MSLKSIVSKQPSRVLTIHPDELKPTETTSIGVDVSPSLIIHTNVIPPKTVFNQDLKSLSGY